TPSVAEQEGQQTETEATGAPQKHHYTLNQQVGSITRSAITYFNKWGWFFDKKRYAYNESALRNIPRKLS
ncbi:hypothetical protein LNX12_25950, partial [Klebsiella pneumoniae]|nr:hypothetical protein [Klebsiella pneumoniae]